MESKKDLFRLGHIKDCINKILEIVSMVQSLNDLQKKWLEQDAMIRNFEIIGEASNHISEQTKRSYPSVNWKEMKGMRNYISHEYFGVDLDNIWHTAVHDIPKLKEQVAKIISDLEEKSKG